MQYENPIPIYYETSDLALAAALLSSGCDLQKIDKQNPKRAIFMFGHGTQLEPLVERYWGDNLELNARTYFDAIKKLKGRLYEVER